MSRRTTPTPTPPPPPRSCSTTVWPSPVCTHTRQCVRVWSHFIAVSNVTRFPLHKTFNSSIHLIATFVRQRRWCAERWACPAPVCSVCKRCCGSKKTDNAKTGRLTHFIHQRHISDCQIKFRRINRQRHLSADGVMKPPTKWTSVRRIVLLIVWTRPHFQFNAPLVKTTPPPPTSSFACVVKYPHFRHFLSCVYTNQQSSLAAITSPFTFVV